MNRTLIVAVILLAHSGAAQQPVAPAQSQQAGRASIAGRVTAADTGKPVKGVTLRLLSWEVMRRPRYATSDGQGRFEFGSLVGGQYLLEARHDRYLTTNFGQVLSPDPARPIDLGDAERFDRADIALIRPGAIEGRVVDEFGDGAPNITVQAYRIEYAAGARRLMPAGGRTPIRPTDDRGHFRIFGLAPDSYYLCALSGAFTASNEAGGFAPTYFPGTTDISRAQAVAVAAGRDASGIAIPLVPVPMASVSGILVDPAGRHLARATVFLIVRDHTGVSPLVARMATGADGGFSFRNVPAGAYTIQAFGPPPPGAGGGLGQAPFGYLSVATSGADLDGLRVIVRPGTTMRGRVVFEGDDVARPRPDEVRVFPRPVGFESAPIIGGGPPRSTIDEKWDFEVRDQSGWRIVRVDVQSTAWSLARVAINGVDVTDTPVDFRSADVDGVEVVLTSRGASVTGSVKTDAGHLVRECAVVVFAADRERWMFPSRFVAMARPNQDGVFSVHGLPPEGYLAIAVPSVKGFEWQDPEFLERARVEAMPLVLMEGERRALDLTLTASTR
ncbi:MAG: carboxypeptidase-like regulatory domain-containing protein [Acidobacteriota bacterium]